MSMSEKTGIGETTGMAQRMPLRRGRAQREGKRKKDAIDDRDEREAKGRGN